MKVALLSDSISQYSGFALQTKLLAYELQALGHEIDIIGITGPPNKDIPIRQWFASMSSVPEIDKVLDHVKPDRVIAFHSYEFLRRLMLSKCLGIKYPCFLWLAWEGLNLPCAAESAFPEFPKERIIHLTNFASNLWANVGSGGVIPHGVNLNEFTRKDHATKLRLREKWSDKLGCYLHEDSCIVLNVDRNTERKRWDLVFDYVKQLRARNIKVQLIAHTKAIPSANEFDAKNLYDLAKAYKVDGYVSFSPFDWFKGISNSELCELYNLSDFRLSCSGGEGFGIPTIEAMACGCINIVPSNTCFEELADPFTIKDSGVEYKQGIFWGVPNISGMVERTEALFRNSHHRTTLITHGLEEVKLKYDSKKIASKWDKFLNFDVKLDAGYVIKSYKAHVASSIVKAVYLIAGNCRLFSMGVGPNGAILEYSKYHHIDVTGILDIEADKDVPDYLKLFVKNDLGLPEEAYGNVGVLFNTGKQFSNVGKLTWLFVYEPTINDEILNKYLEDEQLLRRPDLESKVNDKLGIKIDFQIWHTKSLGNVMPVGLQ